MSNKSTWSGNLIRTDCLPDWLPNFLTLNLCEDTRRHFSSFYVALTILCCLSGVSLIGYGVTLLGAARCEELVIASYLPPSSVMVVILLLAGVGLYTVLDDLISLCRKQMLPLLILCTGNPFQLVLDVTASVAIKLGIFFLAALPMQIVGIWMHSENGFVCDALLYDVYAFLTVMLILVSILSFVFSRIYYRRKLEQIPAFLGLFFAAFFLIVFLTCLLWWSPGSLERSLSDVFPFIPSSFLGLTTFSSFLLSLMFPVYFGVLCVMYSYAVAYLKPKTCHAFSLPKAWLLLFFFGGIFYFVPFRVSQLIDFLDPDSNRFIPFSPSFVPQVIQLMMFLYGGCLLMGRQEDSGACVSHDRLTSSPPFCWFLSGTLAANRRWFALFLISCCLPETLSLFPNHNFHGSYLFNPIPLPSFYGVGAFFLMTVYVVSRLFFLRWGKTNVCLFVLIFLAILFSFLCSILLEQGGYCDGPIISSLRNGTAEYFLLIGVTLFLFLVPDFFRGRGWLVRFLRSCCRKQT